MSTESTGAHEPRRGGDSAADGGRGAAEPHRSAAFDHDSYTAYDTLLGTVDLVIGEWRAMVQAEPWADIPPAHLVDSLPEILPKLFRLARDGATEVEGGLR